MAKKQVILDNFYLKTFGIGLGVCCLVWSFMLIQFWWGNHDWPYISQGILLSSGLFEARYSHHLPFVILLEGHLLPVFVALVSLAALVIEALLVAYYLEVPKNIKNYLFMVLFVGLNPYNFVLFYFVHYMVALAFWGAVGIGLLCVAERKRCWYNLLFGGLIFFLILGSYPPNIALVLVLFVAKRLKKYCDKQENFVQICKSGIWFSLQLALGYVGFKFVFFYLKANGILNNHMYNLTLRPVWEIFYQIFPETIKSFLQLFHTHSFMEWEYSLLIFALIAVAVGVVYKCNVSKIGITILLISLFLASRFAFLVSGDSSGFAIFRMEYWGRLGLALFSLAVLCYQKSKVIKNITLFLVISCLCLFVQADFDLQKVQYLGWKAQQKYAVRLKENILEQGFDIKHKYIAVNFDYPRLRMKYFSGHKITGEMVEYPHIFNEDIVNYLFANEKVLPVIIGVEIKHNILIRHTSKTTAKEWVDADFWRDNPENMENIRFWLYNEAKGNSVFVDDKYIVLVLDLPTFYRTRELVSNALDD